MRHTWTLLWQRDEAQMTDSLSALGPATFRRGAVALVTGQALTATSDAKAVGVLDGVIFNDLEAGAPLLARGAPVTDQASLALHAVGWSGLAGLAALRWHGTLAVIHQAQGAAIVARDWQGVGGLYWAICGAGQIWGNDLTSFSALGLTPRLIPPGMAAISTASGVQWQVIPTTPASRAWFRELPDELLEPTAATVRAGLQERLLAAVAACQRAWPNLRMDAPEDRVGAWLMAALQVPAVRDVQALWTLAGADAWLGLAVADPVPLEPGPWPEPEPPEPVRTDDRETRARRVRATWLADTALEAARRRAALDNLPIVAPHLDPAVLAWLSAVAPEMRPLA